MTTEGVISNEAIDVLHAELVQQVEGVWLQAVTGCF